MSEASSAASSKSKAKSKKTRTPSPLKYDMDRTVGPDPRDPRAQGFPCFGNHVAMKEGRGSLSGRNGHGRWTTCEKCRLRLSYTPTFGSKGTYRSAGPLPNDIAVTLDQVKESVEKDPDAREKLNTEQAAVIGAEESLRRKLKKLEEERLNFKPKTRPSASVNPEVPTATLKVITEDTKKAVKREGEMTAEKSEASTWVKVDSEKKEEKLVKSE